MVQETNLVLWRKIDEFQPEKPFLPWAFAIARFQVLAHLRGQKRDRSLLDADLVEKLSDEAQRQGEQIDAVGEALRPCLGLLTPKNRELIERRYLRAMPVADVAEAVDRTVGSIKVALLRIRRQLVKTTRIGTASIGNWSLPTMPNADFAIWNLNGSMDEFVILAAALTADEIKEMYENGKP